MIVDPHEAFRVGKKGVSWKPVGAGKAREGSRDRIGKSQRCYSVVRPTD
jgi:hypothetical protein